MVSNVSGTWFSASVRPDGGYWRRHARSGVLFADGLDTLLKEGFRTFLEIGPAPVLCGFGRRHPGGNESGWMHSLSPSEGAWSTMLRSLGRLYEKGINVDWRGFDRPYHRTIVDAPVSCFEREVFWLEAPAVENAAEGPEDGPGTPARTPILSRRIRAGMPLFESRLPNGQTQYLLDHRVQGAAICPASAFLSMALAAYEETHDEGPVALADVAFREPLIFAGNALGGNAPGAVQTSVQPLSLGDFAFEVCSLKAGTDREVTHARGVVRPAGSAAGRDRATLEGVRARCNVPAPVDEHYAALAARGLEYGPRFRCVRELWRRSGEALARIEADAADAEDCSAYRAHPALVDAAFQAVAAAVPPELFSGNRDAWIPVGVKLFEAREKLGRRGWAHAVVRSNPSHATRWFEADVVLYTEDGRIAAEASGLRLQRLGAGARDAGAEDSRDLSRWRYQVSWEEAALAASSGSIQPGTWLIFANGFGSVRNLAARIRGKGHPCLIVEAGGELRISSQSAAVDGDSEEAIQRLFQALAADGAQLGGVIWFCPVGDEADGAASSAADTVQRAVALAKALVKSGPAPKTSVCLVTRGADAARPGESPNLAQAPLAGFARVFAAEHRELRILRIDLDPQADTAEAGALMQELISGAETEVAFRGGKRLLPALRPAAPAPSADPDKLQLPETGDYALDFRKPGDFESLHYRPLRRPSPGPGQVEIAVSAAALNFSDVMKVMGLYPVPEDGVLPLGAECAGRVVRAGAGVELEAGMPVAAVAPYSFSSSVVTDARLAMRLPDGMTAEEGATIPVVFLTAEYALNYLARMGKGDRVLIHAGAGGVGLAAIQLAQRAGAEVFATAGSPEKRSFLEYLGVRHVFDSRTLEFADQIRKATNGEGVDIVLNSLAGAAIPRSLSVLRPYGRFLEIGKTDIYQNSRMPLECFRNNLSYFAIDLDRMFRDRADFIQTMLTSLAARFERRELRPLPRRVFEAGEAVQAFRFMAQRKNTGKVIFTFGKGERERRASSLGEAGTYLITGAYGSLGLELTEALARQGVAHFALVSRSPARPEALARLERTGAIGIRHFQADVSDGAALATVLEEIDRTMPPLKGVIHAAGVIQDAAIGNLTAAQVDAVLAPKVRGAWNLQRFTAGRQLEQFVLFSSAAALLGSPGQAHYAAGNSFLDALACYRKANGQPALSVNWGAFAGGGMAAAQHVEKRFAALGIRPIAPADGMDALADLLMAGAGPNAAIIGADWARLTAAFGGFTPTLLRALAPAHEQTETQAPDAAGGRVEISRESVAALEPGRRAEVIEKYLRRELSRLSEIPEERIDIHQPLNSIGLDSLTMLELKTKIESKLGIAIPIATLAEGPSIVQLVAFALEQAFPKASSAVEKASAAAGAETEAPMPFTFAQRRVLADVEYREPLRLTIAADGPHEAAELADAFTAVVERHGVLGAALLSTGGAAPRISYSKRRPEVRMFAAENRAACQAAAAEWAVSKPTDDGLVKACVFHAPEFSLLTAAADPLVFDFASRHLLFKDLLASLRQARAGGSFVLPPLSTEFRDYAAWEQEHGGMGGEAGKASAGATGFTSRRRTVVEPSELDALHEATARHGLAALDDLLIAAFCGALRSEAVFAESGCRWLLANRDRAGLEEVIGPLATPAAVPAAPGDSPLSALDMVRHLSREPGQSRDGQQEELPLVLVDRAMAVHKVGDTRLQLQPPQGAPAAWRSSTLNMCFVASPTRVVALAEYNHRVIAEDAVSRIQLAIRDNLRRLSGLEAPLTEEPRHFTAAKT
jgi:NADPH:quinone reductase-like Zn-dependent oxidoreductase/acyl carrier protein